MIIKVNSLLDTVELAKKIAPKLKRGDILLLTGDLGAGKTTFTKSLCQSLGVTDNVTSPTFALLNEYNSGVMPVRHFDLYRVESILEAMEFGFDEYIKNNDGLVIIEWPEVVQSLLPSDTINITIRHLGENEREFCVEGIDV